MATATMAETEDLEEFEDACDVQPLPQGMTLTLAVEQCQQAINYFFNNKFQEARSLMEPWAKSSMYHSLGNAVFIFLEAMLTFEHRHIVAAGEALKNSLLVSNAYRRKTSLGTSIGKIVKKTNYDSFTEEEIHSELCHAESLLLKAMLTFMEDETLSSFIKAGIKIRSCHNSYKECHNLLINRKWDDITTKVHFESGVRMGIGTFNLMISLLPSRVIKLLEFIGFSGNKESGIRDLEIGYRMKGIRQVLCVMTLLGYHLIVMFILSHQEGDLQICEDILKDQLQLYPEGVWFLFFKGRLEFMKGNLEDSINWYTKSWKSQNVWQQFHHMCFWELIWVNCVTFNWRDAALFAGYLVSDSRWSRTIYSYQKATILLMCKDKTKEELVEIDKLMQDVPKYKQRIAGKSLPMEKFAVKKSERFFRQEKTLTLPAIELMYLWNLFKIIKQRTRIGEGLLKIIDQELHNINSATEQNKYDTDNRALVLLLKGACLRQLNSPLQALECLETAISMQKQIVEDNYIIPYAIVELALLEWDRGDKSKAILALEDAKKNYTGYSLESRLHFRIHTALYDLKAKSEIVGIC